MAGIDNDTPDTGQDDIPSLRDILGDAIEEHTGPDADAAAPATPPARTEGRSRGTDGKFAPGATADTPPHIADTPRTAQKAQAAAPLGGAEAENPAQSPQSWKPEAKAHWERLPPEVRQEVQRREREISVGLQRARVAQEASNAVMAEFQPYSEILRNEGATPQDAMKVLLETAFVLRHGSPAHKHALMLSLAKQYGVDLGQPFDPEKARAQWELDSYRAAEFRNQRGAAAQEEQEIVQAIGEFVNSPGHEHYETVKPHMIALLQNGQATSLQDAYDQAMWANPNTRKVVLEQTQLQNNTARAANLGRNRAAASAVTGAPGAVSSSPSANPKDLRATIEAAMGGR